MNRAQRRQLARAGGWRGVKARTKRNAATSPEDGIRRAVAVARREVASAQREQYKYEVDKERARELGLWVPE
jgi:hypothetical protein